MNEREFELMQRIEDDHWWFVGKRLILTSLLGRGFGSGRLLDLGCGTGGVVRELAGHWRCTGVDRSELALRICRDKGFTELARGDLSAPPFAPGSFDTIVALDVIEHLDDDVGFLRQAAQLCAPGGRVIVSVPALQLLWSRHDETFEHRRRYSARQLRRVVAEAGFELERTTYTSFFVFPPAAVWRLLSSRLPRRLAPATDFWPLPKVVNALLVQLYRLEAWLLRYANLPIGVSVACVARRP